MEKKFKNQQKKTNNFKKRGSLGKTDKLDSQTSDEKNNYMFYAADEQIAKDAASVPFNYISGGNFQLKGDVYNADSSTGNVTQFTDRVDYNKSLLNLSVIHYIPSIGITNAKNEGVNMSSLQLYAYVRRSNSGARNYEAPDMMMYGLAYQELLRAFFEAKRAIGLVNKTHYYNHAFPDLILQGLGVDANDLRAHSAEYRGRLNTIAKKINSFAFPKIFKSFDRMAYVSNFLFCDSTSPRAQFYAMKADGYYYWSGTTSETGTELVYVPYFGENTKQNRIQTKQLRLYLTNLEQMIDALFLDEDALTMSGDIMKAFPESELYHLDLIDENFTTESFFDEDFLGQIENAKFAVRDWDNYQMFKAVSEKTFNVTQENQIIKFNPQIVMEQFGGQTSLSGVNYSGLVFNSHVDNPDYKNVLEWTRLAAIAEPTIMESDSTKLLGRKIKSCGLELPLYMMNIYYTFDSDGNNTTQADVFTQEYDTTDNQYDISVILQTMMLDWHPVVYLNTSTSSIYLGFDSKVSTIIPNDIMNRINQTAVYGAFYTGSLFKGSKNS